MSREPWKATVDDLAIVACAGAFGISGAGGVTAVATVALPREDFLGLCTGWIALDLLLCGSFSFGLAILWTREFLARRVPSLAPVLVAGLIVGAALPWAIPPFHTLGLLVAPPLCAAVSGVILTAAAARSSC